MILAVIAFALVQAKVIYRLVTAIVDQVAPTILDPRRLK